MRHYVRAWLPIGEWEDFEPMNAHGCTVFEPERKAVPTGLVDRHGTPLMAVDRPNPIGFLAKHDA